MMKNILLLGASGSIGTQSIEIIREHKDKLCLKGVSVGKNVEYLRSLLEEFDLKFVYSIDKQKDLMEKYPNVHFYYAAEANVNVKVAEIQIELWNEE